MLKIESINTVSIVGAGNVGWHMAHALHHAGIHIKQVLSRTPSGARELADAVSAEICTSYEELDADLLLLCVPDSILPGLSASIIQNETLIFHTSGSTGLEVFGDLRGYAGVFYPFQTFTKSSPLDYANIPFLLEADNDQVFNLQCKLADRISGNWQRVDSHKRGRIHLAAVFACNFTNHMMAIASSILSDEGLDMDLLHPILDETFKKLKKMNPVDAQTGPAAREDRVILQKHMEALEGTAEEEIYKLLSESIIRYKIRK